MAPDDAIAAPQEGVTHHVRFEVDGRAHCGILEGETIRELSGPPYNDPPETGWTHALADVRLLAPVEPRAVLAVGLNYGDLEMVGRLNGQEVQRTNSSELIFDIPSLVAYITQWVTRHPGDVIFSGTPGTPGGEGELQPGDVFEVEVVGVGTLRNSVVSVGGAAVASGG